MSDIEIIAPVRIADTDVSYAQAVKAGNWIFLTGHEATDFTNGLASEVGGKTHYPMHGVPKNRREGDFILERFQKLLAEAGSDLAHGVRLDQYYPTWKAVDPYHHARRAHFGDYIPPSTSVIVEELLVEGAEINASLLAVIPGEGREIHRVKESDQVESPFFSSFAPAITCGDYVFVAGQMANAPDWSLDPRAHVTDNALWAGYEIRKQAEFIIDERIKPALAAAGSSLANIVKAQVYLTDIDDAPHFVEVWNACVGNRQCALSVVLCSQLAIVNGTIEINVMALVDEGATKKQIVDVDIPATIAYGAPAVRAGDLLLFSALMAAPEDQALRKTGLRNFGQAAQAQTRYILDHAERIAEAGGTSLANTVRAHQFHTDLSEVYSTYRVWQEKLPGQPIPFAAVRVAAPMPAAACTVMVDLWAYAP
ncbi:MAG: Rid family hydrolase [Proteobacteria bacterium]|nr:Rid family hydrolase [Pseudomonadota bacterium]